MATKAHLQTQFNYHWHTTNHLLDCAEQLSAEDYFAEQEYSRGSIHGIFFHMLTALIRWRAGLENEQQIIPLSEKEFPDLAAIRSGMKQEQAAWDAYLQKLNDTEIDGMIELTSPNGNAYAFPHWHVLQHLVLHGMQHHSELAQLLTEQGHSPGDLDFIFFKG